MKRRLAFVLLPGVMLCTSVLTDQASTFNPQYSKPELVIQTGHTSYVVSSVAFSPDGRLLASVGYEKTVMLWDVATGRELRTLAGHTAVALSVAFSPDGRTLASAGGDKAVKLWDVASGRELRTLAGHLDAVNSVAFSPQGLMLASGSDDKTVKLWDMATGRELRTLIGHAEPVNSVAFSPDGRVLASGSRDKTVKLWDVNGRELRTLVGHAGNVLSVVFSRDGHILVSGSGDKTVKIWDMATAHELRTFSGNIEFVNSVALSPHGRILALGSADKAVKLWDVATGRELRTLVGHASNVLSLAFSQDGRVLASGSWDNMVKLWDTATGQELRTLVGHAHWVDSVAFSSDGRALASLSPNDPQARKLWDLATGRGLRTIAVGERDNLAGSLVYSPDGRTLALGRSDKTVRLWDAPTKRELRALVGHADSVISVAFSPDGRLLASGSSDSTAKLWDVATGRELRTLVCHGTVQSVAFSPEGRVLASGSWDKMVKLWDTATGQELRTLAGHSAEVNSVAFSPDGRLLASGSSDSTAKLWDIATGREVRTMADHTAGVRSVAFSPDGRWLASGSMDGSVRIWDVINGKQLATLVALDEKDWAVVDPAGRFDASPGGMELMHWAVGLEPIALQQLKQRYYEPGLLPKILGFNKEPLRDVSAFDRVALYPEIEPGGTIDASGKLHIRLKNRGGGIGPVQILINGKELLADARGPKPARDASEAALTIELSGAALLHGSENEISVVARNAEGYLASRGFTIIWKSPGTASDRKPELYAIVSGISEYSAPALRLTFSAKDAEDMARALEIGGKRLFGPDHIHLAVLSSAGKAGELAATKANLKHAFEAAQKAQPGDVLVVYLAGHGVAVHDTYAYPTQEARTLDLSDPAVREQTSIASEELVEWIKKIPALHQVMILDTCAAGAAAFKLVEKRDVPGDQIRALDRLKDRTGFHVLMGSAADAVSYEASQYGQGLLTYTLLQGMKGAALKNDVDVDVSTLFQYAADKVPELARGIGGVQKPQIIAPLGGASFDVGQLLQEDKQQIPLAAVKPLILRPTLLDAEALTDDLELMLAVRKQLREQTYAVSRGGSSGASAIFVDEEEMPGAIRPSGTYTVDGKQVWVRLVLTRDDKRIRTEVQGPVGDVSGLATKIVAAILQASKNF